MKKSTIIRVASLVLVMLTVLSLAGCGPKDKVKDSVFIFIEKANALDIQGMFDNMAVETIREIRGNKSLEVFLSEKTDEEVIYAIVRKLVPFSVDDPAAFLKSLKVEYTAADIRGDFAAFYGKITYEVNGQTITKDGVVNMLRKNVSEPWRVRDFAL